MPGDITVTNIVGTNDTVAVANVTSGDIIKVYADESGKTLLKNSTASGTSIIILITQLSKSAGTIYVSVTSSGKQESKLTPQIYGAEPAS
jgi:hypothetical protein